MKVKDLVKIPDFVELKKFIVFESHPDDADIFMGGTIKWLTDKSKDVTFVTVTDGRKGTYDPSTTEENLKLIRKKERERAGKILGIKKILMLNYEDLNLPDNEKLTMDFLRIIRHNRNSRGKLKTIETYKSQFPTEESVNFIRSYLTLKHGEYEEKIKVKFAEAFKVLSTLHLHTNMDALNM